LCDVQHFEHHTVCYVRVTFSAKDLNVYVTVIVVLCWFTHVYSYDTNSLQEILILKFFMF